MKTAVIPIRGHMRGKLGYIRGDLADDKSPARSAGQFRTAVFFPGETFPRDMRVLRYVDLRKAEGDECALQMTMELIRP